MKPLQSMRTWNLFSLHLPLLDPRWSTFLKVATECELVLSSRSSQRSPRTSNSKIWPWKRCKSRFLSVKPLNYWASDKLVFASIRTRNWRWILLELPTTSPRSPLRGECARADRQGFTFIWRNVRTRNVAHFIFLKFLLIPSNKLFASAILYLCLS